MRTKSTRRQNMSQQWLKEVPQPSVFDLSAAPVGQRHLGMQERLKQRQKREDGKNPPWHLSTFWLSWGNSTEYKKGLNPWSQIIKNLWARCLVSWVGRDRFGKMLKQKDAACRKELIGQLIKLLCCQVFQSPALRQKSNWWQISLQSRCEVCTSDRDRRVVLVNHPDLALRISITWWMDEKPERRNILLCLEHFTRGNVRLGIISSISKNEYRT